MMDLISWIVLLLLLTPIYGVVTDLKSWKIKNYFIFPALIISFVLTFFIEWFYYDFNNIIWLVILLLFGFLFYKWNKWWAWDWKYIILIGLNIIIIWFLLWFNVNILNILFLFVFWILFLYNLFFVIINYKEVFKIKFKKNYNFKIIDFFFISSFIYIFSFYLSLYLGGAYIYIITFLSILFLLPLLNNISNQYLRYIFISFWVISCIYTSSYYIFFLISAMYFFFIFLQSFSDQLFDIIDVVNIKILDIKSGEILTQNSINLIKGETGLDYHEAPLQWNEVFDITNKYKELWFNPSVQIYKDLKIWIIMFIWYLVTFFFYV